MQTIIISATNAAIRRSRICLDKPTNAIAAALTVAVAVFAGGATLAAVIAAYVQYLA